MSRKYNTTLGLKKIRYGIIMKTDLHLNTRQINKVQISEVRHFYTSWVNRDFSITALKHGTN
jgi:hypothetical protein